MMTESLPEDVASLFQPYTAYEPTGLGYTAEPAFVPVAALRESVCSGVHASREGSIWRVEVQGTRRHGHSLHGTCRVLYARIL